MRLASLRRAGIGLAVLAVSAVACLTPSAAVAAAPWHHCGKFAVSRTYRDGSTYVYAFYDMRARGVSCRRVAHIVHDYLFGKGHALGRLPTSGVRVDGWSVLLHTDFADGRHGAARFSGRYH